MIFTPTADIPCFTLNDGTSMPILQWGNGTGDAKQKAVQAGKWVLESGIRAIDTAQGYNNEDSAGDVFRASGLKRENVWITTKISQPDGRADLDPIPVASLRGNVLKSIKTLGLQPDLILIHNPFVPPPGELVAFWQVLEKMKDDGELTASLGVSNFRVQDLEVLLPAAKYKPVCNQLELHPFLLTQLSPLLELQAKHKIIATSFGPLSPILRHPTKGGPLKPVLNRIATRLGVDEAAALLLWTKLMGVGIITASGNEGRIKKLAEVQTRLGKKAGEEGTLTKEEVEEIEKVGRGIHWRAYDEHMCVDVEKPDLPSQ